jgi:hypothetical protein
LLFEFEDPLICVPCRGNGRGFGKRRLGIVVINEVFEGSFHLQFSQVTGVAVFCFGL